MLERKKLIINNQNAIRLNKYISDSGVCSRREADRLVEAGKVKVNGEVAVMGLRIKEGDVVTVDGKPVKLQERLVLLAVNKPVGIECTTDRTNPDNIISFLNYPQKIFYIGRLDKNSHGLILMTNDGDLANRISKSVNKHEKEYIVKVNKKIDNEFIINMSNGVKILDTVTRKCKVNKIDDYTFNIILTQGLNRQIRRMCNALGFKVIDLKRIRVMNIKLGNLQEGSYRNVSDSEISQLISNS
jgi:23S rRNA pseudouridine2604 synthase